MPKVYSAILDWYNDPGRRTDWTAKEKAAKTRRYVLNTLLVLLFVAAFIAGAISS